MKVVNLSRRRFVNIRPVARTTAVLWLVATALVAANLFLFLQYWIDSVEIRGQREQTFDLIGQQQDAIRELDRRFDSLDLAGQNEKVEYLNGLIGRRTFPWSELFDDLEEVLVSDARVISVRPQIEVKKRQRSRRQPVVARRGRRASQERAEEAAPKPPPEPERQEVVLSLRGFVKNDDALADLLDAFYADPSFASPFLASENIDQTAGTLSFDLQVIYLLPTRTPAAIRFEEEAVTADAALQAAAGGEEAAAAVETTDPARPGAVAQSLAEPQATVAEGPGPSTRARAAGPPAAGLPAAGTPAAGTPAAGTPAAGTPIVGTAIAGTPAAATPPGTPPTGTPAAGTPAAGTPAAGTPAAGTPAAGTPAAGTPPPAAVTPGTPPSPASPPRPTAPDSPRSPPPPPVRPTFVGPEATGTPQVGGGGGNR